MANVRKDKQGGKLDRKHLKVAYLSEAAFQAEYSKNIAIGGVFLPTVNAFEIRDPVLVEIKLGYCDQLISLEGEVVRHVPPELAKTGASPGVAVQFSASAAELRSIFAPYVVERPAPSADEAQAQAGRRTAARTPARVTAQVRSAAGPDLVVRTRDISKTGVLISAEGQDIPIGQSVKVELTNPVSGEEMQVEGSVVRHVRAESGDVTALGIEFQLPDQQSPEVGSFIDRVQTTEHSRGLGGINGPIEELGVEGLMRMFGATTHCGTLILSRAAEEGTVIFAGGGFVTANIGKYNGIEALERLLIWREGIFEFEARVDSAFEGAAGTPIDLVLSEIRAGISSTTRPREPLARGTAARTPDAIPKDAKLCVVPAVLDQGTDGLSKTEESVIDLAIVGMPITKVLRVVPDTEEAVLTAISSLRERGLVTLES